jgi:hypothetical protein
MADQSRSKDREEDRQRERQEEQRRPRERKTSEEGPPPTRDAPQSFQTSEQRAGGQSAKAPGFKAVPE